MKRFFWLIFLTSSVYAQSHSYSTHTESARQLPFEIIPNFQITSTTFTGANSDLTPTLGDTTAGQKSTHLGAIVGVAADLELANRFTFESGLDYLNLGSSYALSDLKAEFSMSYLGVPTLVKWSLTQTGTTPEFYFKGGLIHCLLLSSKMHKATTKTEIDSDLKGSSATFNEIAELGAGMQFPLGRTSKLDLGISYLRGLTSVSGDGSAIYFEGFTVGAGIALAL